MSKKVNPHVFRLGKTKTWDIKCFEKKSTELAVYSFKNLEIKQFIYKFFKNHGLIIYDCKIQYLNESSLYIYISYYLRFKKNIKKTFNTKFRKSRTKKKSPVNVFSSSKTKHKKKNKNIIIKKHSQNYKPQFRKVSTKKSSINIFRNYTTQRKKKKYIVIKKRGQNYKTQFRKFSTKDSPTNIFSNYTTQHKKKKYIVIKKHSQNYKSYKKYLAAKNLYNTKPKKKNYFIIKKKTKKYRKYNRYLAAKNPYNAKPKEKNYFIIKKKTKKYRKYNKYLTDKNLNNKESINKNNFLSKFFDSLHLFINKKINIFLTVHQLNTKLCKNIEEFKKFKNSFFKYRRYEKQSFFKEGLSLLFASIKQMSSTKLLAQYVAKYLGKLNRHSTFLKFLKNVLKTARTFSIRKIEAVRIRIKGRLNGARRAKDRIIHIGKDIPNVRISAKISYSEETAFSNNGTFGVKVWMYEKN